MAYVLRRVIIKKPLRGLFDLCIRVRPIKSIRRPHRESFSLVARRARDTVRAALLFVSFVFSIKYLQFPLSNFSESVNNPYLSDGVRILVHCHFCPSYVR